MLLRRLPVLALLAASLGQAQTVVLVGIFPGKALVIVDGNPPKGVAVGESFKGVRIVSAQGDFAVVDIAGKQHTLRLGETPANVGAGGRSPDPSKSKLVLAVGAGGHFVTPGQINGKPVQLMVDTGATAVAMSISDAQRIGLDYQSGASVPMSTANGVVQSWRVKLASVRVGDVTVNDVESVVSAGAMPYVLLGNSFLAHFQMTRNNEQMVLEKRP